MKRLVHLLSLCLAALPAASARGQEDRAELREACRKLGQLRAALAAQASDRRELLTAGHFYLSAAQAFQLARDDEARKAQMQGMLATRSLRATWLHEDGVVAAAFVPGAKQVLTCGARGDLHYWDAATGREVRSLHINHPKTLNRPTFRAIFNQDRTRLAVWGPSWGPTQFQVWDVARGEPIFQRQAELKADSVQFTRDEKRFLLWGFGQPPYLWDVTTGRFVQFGAGHTPGNDAKLSADESRVLTINRERMQLWDTASGKLLWTLQEPTDSAHFKAMFSPDDKHVLALGYEGGKARLWETKTGQPVRTFTHNDYLSHPHRLRGAEFSKDGSRLLTWGGDPTARLWDVRIGEVIQCFGDAQQARLSRNDAEVVTTGRAGVARWDAKSGKLLRRYNAGSDVRLTKDASQIFISIVRSRKSTYGTSSTRCPICGPRNLSPASKPGRLPVMSCSATMNRCC
jgi:WD40 repeat protein